MYPRITKLIFDEWQEVWDCCTGNKLHAIRSTVGYCKQKTCLSRRDTVLLNRLRIGHTHLTHSYLLSGDDLPALPMNCQFIWMARAFGMSATQPILG